MQNDFPCSLDSVTQSDSPAKLLKTMYRTFNFMNYSGSYNDFWKCLYEKKVLGLDNVT